MPALSRWCLRAALAYLVCGMAMGSSSYSLEVGAGAGQTVLAALAESGLSGRRVANVVSWFIVAQLALGPWRGRGEVRPAELARAMGVSRWTEWRTRLDAARAGLVREWTLPDPEARGYGRGAVRVLELAFARTREVTQRVAGEGEPRRSAAGRRSGVQRRRAGW